MKPDRGNRTRTRNRSMTQTAVRMSCTYLLTCAGFIIYFLETASTAEISNETAVNSSLSLIEVYKERICQLVDTCDLVDQVPKSLRDLRTRNCMCDDKCSLYKDCCSNTNSQHKNEDEVFVCTATSFDYGVSMVKSCLDGYNDESITKRCLASTEIASSYDLLLGIPVTDPNGITFGNVFCAICNEITEYDFWNIGLTYESIPQFRSNNSEHGLPDVNGEDERANVTDIIANLSFNETGQMIWTSKVNGSTYRCNLGEKLPSGLTEIVRYCEPNAIQTCPDGKSCGSNTSYVYSGASVYKNVGCAFCHNVTGYTGCPASKEDHDGVAVTEIFIEEATMLKERHCDVIPKKSWAHHLLCSRDECFGSMDYMELCFIHENFSLRNNDFYYIDNQTIFLNSYGVEVSLEKPTSNDTDTVYICGPTPPRTRYQQIMHLINTILGDILMAISIVGMVAHLIAFLLVPEMQNLAGKNLASFCVALLSLFMLEQFEPSLSWCEIASVVQHYLALSCFVWMLVMSYDIWLSLHKATSKFRITVGKRNSKFLLYSVAGWTLPLLIIAPALYVELAPSSVIDCDWKPGYGKLGECFRTQRQPFYYFFVAPASFIFLLNIGFFARTAYIIYTSQRNTVNPNACHHFRLYSRLGLVMGVTWILGSLVAITDNEIIKLLYTFFNMSQGIFIFFGFTFKRKTANRLVHRHRQNKLVRSVFSSFGSSGRMSTTVSECTAGTKSVEMEVIQSK